jgi:hypothetical protein
MLPPLSAAALLGQNLVGVLLRNEFGFAPILWPFGQSDPAPGNGECPRLKFTPQVCSSPSLQQPESAEAQVARCRTQRQRAGISFVPETYNESRGRPRERYRLRAEARPNMQLLCACFRRPALR